MLVIDKEKKIKLIKNNPFFFNFPEDVIDNFAKNSYEKIYHKNQIIVSRGDLIDSVYLVADGSVEISSSEPGSKKNKIIPQRLISVGEAIGLSRTCLFSETGLRTETLLAVSNVVLIGWDIHLFFDLLANYTEFYKHIEQLKNLVYRIDFIKKAVPFYHLSLDKISLLSKKVKVVEFKKGEIIFHQGQLGDHCFLIESGEVEILLEDEKKCETQIAVLGESALFGESALLTMAPRTATARALTSTCLFELDREDIKPIIIHNTSTADAFVCLMIERCYPIKQSRIISYPYLTEDGDQLAILKDPFAGKYYQLSAEGYFIWEGLNGKKTFQDITISLFKKYNLFAPEMVADIIFDLAEIDFISLPNIHSIFHQSNVTKEDKTLLHIIKRKLNRIINVRFTFKKVDLFFSSTYNKYVHYLYTIPFQMVFLIVSILGLFIFFYQVSSIMSLTIDSIYHFILIFILAMVTNIFSIFLHELAHGYTVKFFKHEVNYAGILFNWVGLAFFVDTSDMWLANKKARVVVGFAGPYMDIFLAGLASLVSVLTIHPGMTLFFWLVALFLYLGVLKNLNPIVDNDGYLILKDWFNVISLRTLALKYVKKSKHSNKFLFAIRLYWTSCFVFLMLELALIIVLSYFLLSVLPDRILGFSSNHLIWILPGLLFIQSMAAILSSLRKIK